MAAAEMARWTSSVSSIASSDTGTDADDDVDDDDDIGFLATAVNSCRLIHDLLFHRYIVANATHTCVWVMFIIRHHPDKSDLRLPIWILVLGARKLF